MGENDQKTYQMGNKKKRCLHPCRPCQSGAMPEFTAVHTLLVSAARCGIKQSVGDVYIRPPNTDSQSRGSRLSIRPAGRHGARQGMVFVLFCWRLDLEDGGRRNIANHQQPCIRSLAIFF